MTQFVVYSLPPGVQAAEIDGRPILTTPQNGKIAVDPVLLSLWEYAQGRTLQEVLAGFRADYSSPQTVRAGLACLAEAGLLVRELGFQFAREPGLQFAREGSSPAPALKPAPEPAPPPPLAENGTRPRVSAIIVGYNSREWLEECIPSLMSGSYSPLDIIFVDNGSGDDSLDWLASHYPSVKCLRLDQPLSLAGAINRGVAAGADAESDGYLLMLNPDVRLDRHAVAHLVAAAEADQKCAAVGAKLRFLWAPAFLNGMGNQVGPFSWGTDTALGHLDLGQYDGWQELPSACFAAALIRRSAWDSVGPVDEGFPMYYEDSEWCYRARALGYSVRAAPQAVVYHAFGGRVPSGQPDTLSPRKLRNVVYGRLRFAIKVTGDYFPRFLRNYLVEDWINITRRLAARQWHEVRAYLGGWLDVLRSLPAMLDAGRIIQSRRTVPDEQLFALQRDMPFTFSWRGLPELTWDLVLNYYSPLMKSERTRPMPEFHQSERRPHLLIVSNDVVDEKMAGPGMRYLEMALAMKDTLDVTLAIPSETKLKVPGLSLVRYWEERPASLQVLVENCDVALVSNYMVEKFPFLHTTAARLVVDLYDPTILENLHYYLNEPIGSQQALNRHGVNITNTLLRLGDFFICGNERQRDFWLGMLAANERINPLTFADDSSLRSLIDVVGIGFPDREVQHPEPYLRGVHPLIPAEARIVLWGGGIWNWLDPLTVIRAWPQVLARHPEARLVFLGTRHPNPLVPVHEMARKAQALAEEIGEKDRSILFIEWVSYADREALLCESDVGVALHPIHVETRYSIRTRVLDYLWARLPVLVTDGDVTSEWVRTYGLGAVVPPFDPEAVAGALNELLDRPKSSWGTAFEPLLKKFRWSQVVQPLSRYCLEGGYAPDRQQRAAPPAPASTAYSGWARAVYILRTEGLRAMMHRGWRHLQWRLSRP